MWTLERNAGLQQGPCARSNACEEAQRVRRPNKPDVWVKSTLHQGIACCVQVERKGLTDDESRRGELMKLQRYGIACLGAGLLFGSQGATTHLTTSAEVLSEIMAAPDRGIPQED